MMGRCVVFIVAAAAVVAALVVFAVWLTAVVARPHKPPSPLPTAPSLRRTTQRLFVSTGGRRGI
ncbi:MAG: hypothetical protein ACO2PN_16580 [Pyrobaculum sp.]